VVLDSIIDCALNDSLKFKMLKVMRVTVELGDKTKRRLSITLLDNV